MELLATQAKELLKYKYDFKDLRKSVCVWGWGVVQYINNCLCIKITFLMYWIKQNILLKLTAPISEFF